MNTIKVGDRVFASSLQCCGSVVARTTTGAVSSGACGLEHHELFNGWFRVQLDKEVLLNGVMTNTDVFMPGELRLA